MRCQLKILKALKASIEANKKTSITAMAFREHASVVNEGFHTPRRPLASCSGRGSLSNLRQRRGGKPW